MPARHYVCDNQAVQRQHYAAARPSVEHDEARTSSCFCFCGSTEAAQKQKQELVRAQHT